MYILNLPIYVVPIVVPYKARSEMILYLYLYTRPFLVSFICIRFY